AWMSGPGGGRPSGPIGSNSRGKDGELAVSFGTTMDEKFAPGDDPARREAFEASRAKRAARQQGAHDIRRQLMASQAQADNQMQVINPFQNPIAMKAMQHNPELGFGAINSLNEALQGRAQLQASNYAMVADRNLRGQLEMGPN